MKFLLDANLPFSAKETFDARHEVVHVRDIGLERAPDHEILTWAKRHNAVIVSRDLDFANTQRVPPAEHCGLVVLRVPTSYSANEIKRVLGAFLKEIDTSQLPHSLVIIEEGRYRIRHE